MTFKVHRLQRMLKFQVWSWRVSLPTDGFLCTDNLVISLVSVHKLSCFHEMLIPLK